MGTTLARDQLESFFKEIQDAFYSGDTDLLLTYLTMPLVVYSAAGVVVLRDAQEFERMKDDYLAALSAMNATQGEISIEARDAPENNRERVTVRSTEFDSAGNPVTQSLIRYFLVRTGDRYAVEMMEYLEAPLPISDVEKIVH